MADRCRCERQAHSARVDVRKSSLGAEEVAANVEADDDADDAPSAIPTGVCWSTASQETDTIEGSAAEETESEEDAEDDGVGVGPKRHAEIALASDRGVRGGVPRAKSCIGTHDGRSGEADDGGPEKRFPK